MHLRMDSVRDDVLHVVNVIGVQIVVVSLRRESKKTNHFPTRDERFNILSSQIPQVSILFSKSAQVTRRSGASFNF